MSSTALFWIAAGVVYMAPTLVASWRLHPDTKTIFWINAPLG